MSREQLLTYLRQYQSDPMSRVFAPLADQYRKMGQAAEGLKICLEGLQHHPRYPGGRVALGHCYFDLGKYEEALKEYEFVLSQHPDNLHAIKGAARCCQTLHQLERAVRYYRMYLFLVPRDEDSREHVRSLESQLRIAPTPPKPSADIKMQQLQFDTENAFSPLDHYRLSASRDRTPTQRVPRTPQIQSLRPKIDMLYKLLQSIRGRIQSKTRLDETRDS